MEVDTDALIQQENKTAEEEQSLHGNHEDLSNNALFSPVGMQGFFPIPIAHVKERNFLVGKAAKSLFCFNDFQRCFPDGLLHLFVGTWNMEKCKVPENIGDFLLPADENYMQEIYVVGVQEASADRLGWEVKMQETLGMNHVLVHSASHGVLHLAVFVRRDLLWFCSTGERNTKDRIVDYYEISQKLFQPHQHKSYDSINSTDRFDHVFWFGDLNFRISQPHQHMKSEVSDPGTYNIEEAMKCDQLKRLMAKNKVFVGFEEAVINFLPTYKFDPGSDQYDTSHKLRVPSYTDRILFKYKRPGSVRNCRYDSVMTIRHSDHRPVYSLYEVVLKRGLNKLSSEIGYFNREVYVQAARIRARQVKKQQSLVCILL